MINRAAVDYFKDCPDVMRVKDVAKALHCSKNTIYDFIDRGGWKRSRSGAILRSPSTC